MFYTEFIARDCKFKNEVQDMTRYFFNKDVKVVTTELNVVDAFGGRGVVQYHDIYQLDEDGYVFEASYSHCTVAEAVVKKYGSTTGY